jgi:hypothetical protein
MHNFQINALIRFLSSSTCFEPQGFIIRKTFCTRSFGMVSFVMHFVSSLAGGRVNIKQTLMMNPCGSKHVEDVKYRIKALI